MIIQAGTKKLVIDPTTGHRTGWHEFQEDTEAKVVYMPLTCETVFVVSEGPDAGYYETQH